MTRLFSIFFAAMLTVCASASAQTVGSMDDAAYARLAAKAQRYFDAEEWPNAVAMYDLMLDQRPDSLSTYSRAIVASAFRGDSIRQMHYFDRSMLYGLSLHTIIRQVREGCFNEGRADLYADFLLTAADTHPWLRRAIDVYLLRYYDSRDDGPMMIAYADRLLAFQPDDTAVQLIKARGYMLDGDYDSAADVYRQVLVHDPDSFEALVRLGTLLNVQGHKYEALPYLEKAKTLRPTPYLEKSL